MDAKTKDIRTAIQLSPNATDAEIVVRLRESGFRVYESWVRKVRATGVTTQRHYEYVERHALKVQTALTIAGITAEQARKFLNVARYAGNYDYLLQILRSM